jgi:hypothetical protein
MKYGFTHTCKDGQHLVTTQYGTFPGNTRAEAINKAMLAERSAEQRAILELRQERRSTRSRVARLREVIV